MDLNMFTIPVELSQRILSFCDPADVASFSRTCRMAYDLIYLPADQYLWRQLFLAHPFDDPVRLSEARRNKALTSESIKSINWQSALTQRLKAQLIAHHSQSADEAEKSFALQTFLSVAKVTAPVNSQESCNLEWLGNILRDSRMLDSGFDSPLNIKLQAQLRSYLALSSGNDQDKKSLLRLKKRRNESRAFSYDLRNYNVDNHWGPYLADRSVNWVHIEHLINVVVMNLRELPGMWIHSMPPLGLEATRPYSAPGEYSSIDWAGVEGTWRRYVCFMDYRDLFAFNFSDLEEDGPRHPKFFEDLRFREATRLIEVKLRIVPSQQIRFYRNRDYFTSEDTSHPPLHFTGTSKGVNGNEAVVEGHVYMDKEGIARWQFMSIYDDSPQWSSTGVQIGGFASSMGVVGIWTTTTHDHGDPVGPFWLWKVEENFPHVLIDYT